MSYNKSVKIALIAAFLSAPSWSHAGSDPTDPDCPIVQAMQELARKVDVYNGMCTDQNQLCSGLRNTITQEGNALSQGLVDTTTDQLKFDPKIALKKVDFSKGNPKLFDCDIEDPDCNGHTIEFPKLRQNILDSGAGVNILMSFPASNLQHAQ